MKKKNLWETKEKERFWVHPFICAFLFSVTVKYFSLLFLFRLGYLIISQYYQFKKGVTGRLLKCCHGYKVVQSNNKKKLALCARRVTCPNSRYAHKREWVEARVVQGEGDRSTHWYIETSFAKADIQSVTCQKEGRECILEDFDVYQSKMCSCLTLNKLQLEISSVFLIAFIITTHPIPNIMYQSM